MCPFRLLIISLLSAIAVLGTFFALNGSMKNPRQDMTARVPLFQTIIDWLSFRPLRYTISTAILASLIVGIHVLIFKYSYSSDWFIRTVHYFSVISQPSS
jgi:hypothetical protein